MHNDQRDLESLYTATKGSDPEWRPVKGVDWSNTIKSVSNVKLASNFAEKKYRACTARAIMADYNAVSDSLKTMKMELVGFHQEMKSMESKIQTWSRNVNLMESRQSQLRLKQSKYTILTTHLYTCVIIIYITFFYIYFNEKHSILIYFCLLIFSFHFFIIRNVI